MALIKWGDDEEQKKNELFGMPVKTVASVQSGSWQPALSGADSAVATDGIFDQPSQPTATQGNYLLSAEKAQVDEQKRQRDAQIAEARRQQAAREANAAALARQQAETTVQEQAAAPKYMPVKEEGGVKGFLKGVGAGIQQGLASAGDVAIQAGAIPYLAARNGQDLQNHLAEVEKVRGWLHGKKDITGNKFVGTQDVEQQALNIVNDKASIRDVASVAGKGLQVGLDATMFMNPAAIAKNAVKPVVTQGAKLIPRIMTSPVVRIAGRDAAFFGGSQGVATTAQEYGRTGDMGEALKAGGTDAVIGGMLQGGLDLAGHGVGRATGKAIEALRPADRMPIVGGVEDIAPIVTPQAPVADGVVAPVGATPVPSIPEVTRAYHGSTNENLTELVPGSQTGSNERRNLVYLAENADTAANYTKNRGTEGNGIGELQDSSTGRVYDVDVEGDVLGAYDFDKLKQLTETPNFGGLSVRTKNQLTSPTGLSADILETNPELVKFLQDNGITSVRVHLVNGGGNELIVLDPSKARITDNITPAEAPVADGIVRPSENVPITDTNTPVVPTEQVRQLQESRAGASQADEAAINQKLKEAEAATPVADNVPQMETPTDGKLTPKQVAERLMPKLASSKDVKKEIATAAGVEKDAASPIDDILRDGKVKPKQAERLSTQFKAFDKQLREYNRLDETNQKGYAENGVDGVSEDISKQNRRAGRELGIITRRLMQEIKRLEISGDRKAQFVNGLVDAIGTRNASILSSAGLLERNIFQEITANTKLAIKNPVKMAKSTFGNGNILKDTAKAELSHWGDTPRSAAEVVKYVVGNVYRTAMIPTTALANTRRGAVRQEFTKWAFKELEGRELSPADAKKLSGTAGNEMEALVNTFIGVDNGMSNRGQAEKALKAWKEYIRTGDDGAKADYLKSVETHSSLADQMIAGIAKADSTKARALSAMKNLIFPFVRTATNLMKTTAKQDLNPFAKSLLDEIRADQRGGAANAINLIKSKLVDYGIMGGAAALASAGVVVYNDGDEVDKPRGWSVKVGDNKYIPVRATSLELPIALAGTGQAMWNDIASGKVRDASYYSGMVTGSLPYIDQFNTTTGAVDSFMSGEDNGYKAKAYAVNTAKSFVPFSNNSVQPYIAGKKGESLNAKTVYDKDSTWQWFKNTVQKSYDPDFYNGLKDSRDNAGRVRTVDNQGVVSNKTINDANTAEFNDRITDLVDYGREAGLGKNTQDMFNTYDTGKNNNFKSVHDSITFLDAVDGKPDNTKKLEKNAKLTDLSTQIREGFYGDSGNELLTLDGKNLYSDVSVPNKDGTKNSKLPLSMQSIKNAIAQTDLPADQRDIMFEVSQKNDDLYAQFKAKNISYEQYAAAKAENEQTYVDILSGSENYQKMLGLFDELDQTGFFEADGLGSTRSGQTYLWNALNALLGSKGATPAANYPDADKGFTPWGRSGNGRSATNKPGDRGNTGIKWSPVGKRSMASVTQGKYTPVSIKVKLGNEVKKDRTQNYSDRSF